MKDASRIWTGQSGKLDAHNVDSIGRPQFNPTASLLLFLSRKPDAFNAGFDHRKITNLTFEGLVSLEFVIW